MKKDITVKSGNLDMDGLRANNQANVVTRLRWLSCAGTGSFRSRIEVLMMGQPSKVAKKTSMTEASAGNSLDPEPSTGHLTATNVSIIYDTAAREVRPLCAITALHA